MTTSSDPPSDPDNDSTRRLVLRLRDEAKSREGAATVWRWLGGLAAGLAITIAGYATTLAQQAAIDHEVVARHEREIYGVSADLDAIRSQLAAMTAILERVERRLDREE